MEAIVTVLLAKFATRSHTTYCCKPSCPAKIAKAKAKWVKTDAEPSMSQVTEMSLLPIQN
jgi:hypothetical protein